VFKVDLIFWKTLLRHALPIGFSLAIAQIFFTVDTVMLGFMRSDEEVGYYNAAYKIIMLFIMVAMAYHDAIFPVISHFYKTSLDSLRKLVSGTERLMAAIAMPLAVGGFILARPIMDLLYGAGYEGGIIAFQILIWAVFILYINVGYSRGLLACNREKWYLAGAAIPAVINVIANFILIPPLGLIGAATGTVLAQASAFLVIYIGFKKVALVPFHRYIFKPSLASIIMAAFLFWGLNGANLSLFPLIAGGAFIYGVLFYLMKGITKEDIRLVQSTILANRK